MESLITEAAFQYAAEYSRVTALLEQDERHRVLILVRPRELDPRWPDVEAMYGRKRAGEGLVHGAVYNGPDVNVPPGGRRPFVYAFVAWNDYPILQRYQKKLDLLLYKRVLESRRWIADQYRKEGMRVFTNS